MRAVCCPQALTHNNLALCYRRMDQSDLCVRHLELAAQLEVQQAAEDAAAAALSTRTSYSGGGGGSGSAIPAEGRVPRTRSRLSKGVLGSKSLSGGGAGAGAGVADAGQAAQGTDAAVATLLSLAAASSSVGRHQEALSYSHRAVLAAARELQVRPASWSALGARGALAFWTAASRTARWCWWCRGVPPAHLAASCMSLQQRMYLCTSRSSLQFWSARCWTG